MRLSLLIIILTLLCDSSSAQAPTHPAFGAFYLSPIGNDKSPGDLENPVATFVTAQRLVRDFKKEHPGLPLTVYGVGGRG